MHLNPTQEIQTNIILNSILIPPCRTLGPVPWPNCRSIARIWGMNWEPYPASRPLCLTDFRLCLETLCRRPCTIYQTTFEHYWMGDRIRPPSHRTIGWFHLLPKSNKAPSKPQALDQSVFNTLLIRSLLAFYVDWSWDRRFPPCGSFRCMPIFPIVGSMPTG